jgi:hypothetical protein
VIFQNCDGYLPVDFANQQSNGGLSVQDPVPANFQFKKPGLSYVRQYADLLVGEANEIVGIQKSEDGTKVEFVKYNTSPNNETPWVPLRIQINANPALGYYNLSYSSGYFLYASVDPNVTGSDRFYAYESSSGKIIDLTPPQLLPITSIASYKNFAILSVGSTVSFSELKDGKSTPLSSIPCTTPNGVIPNQQAIVCIKDSVIEKIYDISNLPAVTPIEIPLQLGTLTLSWVKLENNILQARYYRDATPLAEETVVLYKKTSAGLVKWQTFANHSVGLANEKYFLVGGSSTYVEAFNIANKDQPISLGKFMNDGVNLSAEPIYLAGNIGILRKNGKVSLLDLRQSSNIKEIFLPDFDYGFDYFAALNSRYVVVRGNGLFFLDFTKSETNLPTLECTTKTIIWDCYHFISSQTKFANVYKYIPKYPLYSDGAEKNRLIYIPPGSKIDTTDQDNWIYPKNTMLFKEFRQNTETYEVRLIHKSGDTVGAASWKPYSAVRVTNDKGESGLTNRIDSDTTIINTPATFGRNVPPTNMCINCHRASRDFVLGFEGVQLSGQTPFSLNDLNSKNLVTKPVPTMDIQGSPNAKAALGYMHTNCSTCHSPNGLAAGVGMNLRHTSLATSLQTENAYVTLVQTAKIVPKDPANSRIYIRATSDGSPMPPRPMGLNLTLDPQAEVLFKNWINEL